jgi:hypothetical protein
LRSGKVFDTVDYRQGGDVLWRYEGSKDTPVFHENG